MGAVMPSRQGSLNLDEDQFEDADSHLPLSRQGSVHRSNLSAENPSSININPAYIDASNLQHPKTYSNVLHSFLLLQN
ncbi:hypothetical protein TNCV_1205621 [Trichonephila clavipes]|nr:hypothetical protein TNCV_1205621 [Trichonephila clavipes]